MARRQVETRRSADVGLSGHLATAWQVEIRTSVEEWRVRRVDVETREKNDAKKIHQ